MTDILHSKYSILWIEYKSYISRYSVIKLKVKHFTFHNVQLSIIACVVDDRNRTDRTGRHWRDVVRHADQADASACWITLPQDFQFSFIRKPHRQHLLRACRDERRSFRSGCGAVPCGLPCSLHRSCQGAGGSSGMRTSRCRWRPAC